MDCDIYFPCKHDIVQFPDKSPDSSGYGVQRAVSKPVTAGFYNLNTGFNAFFFKEACNILGLGKRKLAAPGAYYHVESSNVLKYNSERQIFRNVSTQRFSK
ncbi:hypothetical protein DSECCO2_558330 [anaerobic digester metagenome]